MIDNKGLFTIIVVDPSILYTVITDYEKLPLMK